MGYLLKVYSAPIVAKPGPLADDLSRRGGSQVCQRRKCCEKGMVFWYYPVYLGLLQHYLRNEDMVGVARGSPGQAAHVGGKPGQECMLYRLARARIGEGQRSVAFAT
jgi:hypothetical protein